MAKQSKSTNAPKVPDAEPVGDLDKNKVATGDTNAEAGDADASVSASAAGGAPAATSSTDTSREQNVGGTGNPVGPANEDGDQLEIGIDLGKGGDLLVMAVYRDGYYQIDLANLPLGDLMSIIAACDDDNKREIAKALQVVFVWQDDDDEPTSVSIDPTEAERDRYREDYPNLSRAMDYWMASGKSGVPTMRIVSKVEGFWRGGIKHTIKPVDLSMANLTPDRAEALLSEPKLTIELV